MATTGPNPPGFTPSTGQMIEMMILPIGAYAATLTVGAMYAFGMDAPTALKTIVLPTVGISVVASLVTNEVQPKQKPSPIGLLIPMGVMYYQTRELLPSIVVGAMAEIAPIVVLIPLMMSFANKTRQ